jgi:hypothetical protein
MSVNSKPTASQQKMKNPPTSNIFSFIAGVVVIDPSAQPLLSNISASFLKIRNGPHGTE